MVHLNVFVLFENITASAHRDTLKAALTFLTKASLKAV